MPVQPGDEFYLSFMFSHQLVFLVKRRQPFYILLEEMLSSVVRRLKADLNKQRNRHNLSHIGQRKEGGRVGEDKYFNSRMILMYIDGGTMVCKVASFCVVSLDAESL